MDTYMIRGRRALCGSIRVQGSKNSVLPILAAAILCGGVCVIRNCPMLSDVEAALAILRTLGCGAERDGSTVTVDSSVISCRTLSAQLMHRMRSSIIFLGAILSRLGETAVALPGGCELGARPIDLHLMAMRRLGAGIRQEDGMIYCSVRKLRGAVIDLPIPSVGATENAMIAACGAEGMTRITGAAREPEIVDLARFLNGMGASVHGAGTACITVHGKSVLHGTEHTVMPDRIAAVTYLCAAASAGGSICLKGASPENFMSVLRVLERSGCRYAVSGSELQLECSGILRGAGRVITAPYPGFPTDAQAPLMAALIGARGETAFRENIFENRYRHVPGLRKLGADITVHGREAVVRGQDKLTGTLLCSTDLRGGAALAVAALRAEGESILTGLEHIDRGYEDFDRNLRQLGADIQRIKREER